MVQRILPAGFIVPAQPIERTAPPAGTDWVHKIKHDGFRLLVRRDGAAVRLYTRKGNDWSGRYPAIAMAAFRLKAKSYTIDGEAVICGPDGLSLFDELRRRDRASDAFLYAFDLLALDGEDLRPLPLIERKARLAQLLRRSKAGIVLNDHIFANGPAVFAQACRLGAEGIVSKRANAPYRSGRYSAWIKCKNPEAIAVQRAKRELESMMANACAHPRVV
jgi:bifunctional non-homologous end joining protein LigD